MPEILTRVTRKGQITLPVQIRRKLGIKEGDKVALSLDPSGEAEVVLKPVRSVAEMTFGAVTPRRRPEDFKGLRRLFEDETAEEVNAEGMPATE
jgi:AbrB family looped-hinge helix DNA binding protein